LNAALANLGQATHRFCSPDALKVRVIRWVKALDETVGERGAVLAWKGKRLFGELVERHVFHGEEMIGLGPGAAKGRGVDGRPLRRAVDLRGLQRASDPVTAEDDAGRKCFRADQLE